MFKSERVLQIREFTSMYSLIYWLYWCLYILDNLQRTIPSPTKALVYRSHLSTGRYQPVYLMLSCLPIAAGEASDVVWRPTSLSFVKLPLRLQPPVPFVFHRSPTCPAHFHVNETTEYVQTVMFSCSSHNIVAKIF